MTYAAALLLLVLSPTTSFAQDGDMVGPNHIHGLSLELHGNLDAIGVFGGGVRLGVPLVPAGIIRGRVDDELALSLGADLFFGPGPFGPAPYDSGAYLVPIVALNWNFYLGSSWSIFPEVGVALHYGFDQHGWVDASGYRYDWFYVAPDLGFGVRLHLGPRMAVLLRVSTPGGVQLGLQF